MVVVGGQYGSKSVCDEGNQRENGSCGRTELTRCGFIPGAPAHARNDVHRRVIKPVVVAVPSLSSLSSSSLLVVVAVIVVVAGYVTERTYSRFTLTQPYCSHCVFAERTRVSEAFQSLGLTDEPAAAETLACITTTTLTSIPQPTTTTTLTSW